MRPRLRTPIVRFVRAPDRALGRSLPQEDFLHAGRAARKTALTFHAKDDCPEVRREVFGLLVQHEVQFFALVRDKAVILQKVLEHNAKKPDYRYHPNQLYDRCVSRLFRDRLHKDDGYVVRYEAETTHPGEAAQKRLSREYRARERTTRHGAEFHSQLALKYTPPGPRWQHYRIFGTMPANGRKTVTQDGSVFGERVAARQRCASSAPLLPFDRRLVLQQWLFSLLRKTTSADRRAAGELLAGRCQGRPRHMSIFSSHGSRVSGHLAPGPSTMPQWKAPWPPLSTTNI